MWVHQLSLFSYWNPKSSDSLDWESYHFIHKPCSHLSRYIWIRVSSCLSNLYKPFSNSRLLTPFLRLLLNSFSFFLLVWFPDIIRFDWSSIYLCLCMIHSPFWNIYSNEHNIQRYNHLMLSNNESTIRSIIRSYFLIIVIICISYNSDKAIQIFQRTILIQFDSWTIHSR